MAGEIQAVAASGKTLDALVRNSVGQVWQTTTSTFVSYASASRANYLISLAEQGTSGFYSGTFPSAITAGSYTVTVHLRTAAGSAAETDKVIAAGALEWDGTIVCARSSRSTYAGADTAGTTTLLSRVSAAVALAGTAPSWYTAPANFASLSVDVSGRVLLQPTQTGVTIPTVTTLTNAPADTSGITTLLGRLTSTRATNLDRLDATISSRLAPTVAGVAVEVDSATGGVAIDWGRIKNKTQMVSLSNTSIATAAVVGNWSQAFASSLTAAGLFVDAIEVTDGTANTLALAVTSVPSAQFRKGMRLTVYDENTQNVQVRTCTSWDRSTYIATVDRPWDVIPLSNGLAWFCATSPDSDPATAFSLPLAESYAADGATFTPAQALYMIYATVAQCDVSGVTLTARKLDGTTAAMTFTLDSAGSPTSRTRSS